jgi:ribosomal protein S12 methylthiotransferase accessory factor
MASTTLKRAAHGRTGSPPKPSARRNAAASARCGCCPEPRHAVESPAHAQRRGAIRVETQRATANTAPGLRRERRRGGSGLEAFRPRGAVAEDWQLRRSPKYTLGGVVRTVPPSATIERVLPLMELMGVTRIADVTGLDRVGIANFTTVRPRERGIGISYYNGKGLTRTAARAGALMEAVERYSGEFCDLPVHFATRDEMDRFGATVDPDLLYAPPLDRYEPRLRVEWVEGFDLLSKRATFVPLNAVVCPYEPPPGRPLVFFASSNGLASGNTYEEALCSALCEVIERDADAIASAVVHLAPAIARIVESTGVRLSLSADAAERFPLVDLDTLPPRPRTLARKLRRARLAVYLRDLTSPVGVPTLGCTIVERRLSGRDVAHSGWGAHPDARVAAARALTEAAQSRLGHIQGGREDLPHIVAHAESTQSKFDPNLAFGGGRVQHFDSIASYEHERVDDDVRFMLNRLRADGFSQAVAFDMTRPEVGIPVVRLIVPGAESWGVFLTHGYPSASSGQRVSRALYEALVGEQRPLVAT